MLDEESSQRLTLLRFPLIVGVVFIHGYATQVELAGGTIGIGQTNFITEFVRNIISQGLAWTAVPLFFLISGYLFFAGSNWSKEQYLAKLKIRTRTLLVPFLFWNLATLLLIALAQAMPATKIFFSGWKSISSYSPFDYVSAIFGIGRFPIAYQFWFIRDLMLLVLLAPIIAYANRLAPLPFLIGLFICWLSGVWPIFAPSGDAALFFSVGAFLGSSRKSLFAINKYGTSVITIYLPILVADALLIHESFSPYLHRFGVAIGVVAVLFSTKWAAASPSLKRAILSLSGASVFVYAAHEPLLTIARKLAYITILPDSSYLVLALYFLIPTLVIVFLIGIHRILSDLFPNLMSVITGGR